MTPEERHGKNISGVDDEHAHDADTATIPSRRRFSENLARRLHMRRWQLSIALATMALIIVIVPAVTLAARRNTAHFEGQVLSPAPVQDFALTDQHGAPWRLSDQRGKAMLIYFGYTHCPDVCPATLSLFHDVDKQLGGDANRVRFVFITIDPDRDTPPQLDTYLAAFDPMFVGLTGTSEQMDPVYQSFGVYRKQGTPTNDGALLFSHSSQVFGIDPHGNLRVVHDFGDTTEAYTHDVRLLLKD